MSRSKSKTSGFARVGAVATAIAGFALGTVAFAAQQSQGGFVPLKPGDITQEALPATPLVYAAYGFVWVALIGYVFLLWMRLGRVERELAEVNARLAKRP
jgi:CcmD family protein